MAAMVVAIRRRRILGRSASNRLFAGAGLTLLAHALVALRPLLRNGFDRQPWFDNVAEMINVLSLTQFTMQATGLVLIVIVAVAAGQRRLTARDDAAASTLDVSSAGAWILRTERRALLPVIASGPAAAHTQGPAPGERSPAAGCTWPPARHAPGHPTSTAHNRSRQQGRR